MKRVHTVDRWMEERPVKARNANADIFYEISHQSFIAAKMQLLSDISDIDWNQCCAGRIWKWSRRMSSPKQNPIPINSHTQTHRESNTIAQCLGTRNAGERASDFSNQNGTQFLVSMLPSKRNHSSLIELVVECLLARKLIQSKITAIRRGSTRTRNAHQPSVINWMI